MQENAAVAAQNSGDWKLAKAYLIRLKQSHPDYWPAYLMSAQAMVINGEYDNAETCINEGVQRFAGQNGATALEQYKITRMKRIMLMDQANDFLFQIWRLSRDSGNINSLAEVESNYLTEDVSTLYTPIQYWSQGEPPEDVGRVTKEWNRLLSVLGIREIKVFCKSSAYSFIEQNQPTLLEAFSTAPHYAAESDVFRLAHALTRLSIWIDSDLWPRRSTNQILAHALRTGSSTFFLYDELPFVQNSFFVSANSCPIFSRIGEELKGYSYADKELNHSLIHDSFGPGAYNRALQHANRLYGEPILSYDKKRGLGIIKFDKPFEINLVNEYSFAYMCKPGGLAYKKTNLSWQRAVSSKNS